MKILVIQLNLNSRKGASKIISLIVIVGLILSALTIGLAYYPKILQNNDVINDESDGLRTSSIPESTTEPSSEPNQGILESAIEVLSTNITGWHHIFSDYWYYQIQFRIKNIGNEDLEIKYIVVDTSLATEKSTDEIQQLINTKAISENYLTDSQNKIIPFGGEKSFTIYTENLQNETEHTIRLHLDDNEDYIFNITTNINSENTVEYPKYERVSIISAICTKHHTGGNWTITLKLRNDGTATAKLIFLSINDVGVNSYDATPPVPADEASTDMSEGTLLPSGATITVNVYIDDTYLTLKSGTVVNIKIHSAGGMDYIRLVELV